MKTNRAGIELIKEFEGFRAQAYLCPAKVWTIGYGTTTAADVVEGGVHKGMTVTKDEASDMLSMSLWKYEAAVTKALMRTPTENQFSAMVSLCYNIGESAFAKSTVLRKFNAGDLSASAAAFRMWNKGGGKVLPGLIRRREAELALFSTPAAKGEPPVLADFETPTEKETIMFDVKSIFRSKTIWGVVLMSAPTVANIFGMDLTTADATAAFNSISTWVTTTVELGGALLAIYGRMTAKATLTIAG